MTKDQIKRFRELTEMMSQGKELSAIDYTKFLIYCRAAADDAEQLAGHPTIDIEDLQELYAKE